MKSIEYNNLHTFDCSQFSFFFDDIVIGCLDISELCREAYVTLRISSATCSCNFRMLAYFTIWISRTMRKQIVLSPLIPWLVEGVDLVVLWGSLMLLPEDVDLVCTILSVNSSNHSGKSCNRFLDARVIACKSRVFFLCIQQEILLNSQGVLHSIVQELKISTKLLHVQGAMLTIMNYVFDLLSTCMITHSSTQSIRSQTIVQLVCPLKIFTSDEYFQICHVDCSLFVGENRSVRRIFSSRKSRHVDGFPDSSGDKSVLLIICIDEPESTKNVVVCIDG